MQKFRIQSASSGESHGLWEVVKWSWGGLEWSYEIDMFRKETHFILKNALRGLVSLEQLSLRVKSLEMHVTFTSQRKLKAGNVVGLHFHPDKCTERVSLV